MKKYIICDLDGTLCLFNGRSPYDTGKCESDLISEVVSDLIYNKDIILVSGREDKFRPETESWLSKHKINYEVLLMRKAGDFRNDAIVKEEIYINEIMGKYDIHFVLDDRNRVVEMWRKNGLVCLQVADGNF